MCLLPLMYLLLLLAGHINTPHGRVESEATHLLRDLSANGILIDIRYVTSQGSVQHGCLIAERYSSPGSHPQFNSGGFG